MPKPPTVWGIKGVRMLPDGHARLPSGERILLERDLQESPRPPLTTNGGKLRILDTGPERLLLPRLKRGGQSSFELGSSAVPPPPPTTTSPP